MFLSYPLNITGMLQTNYKCISFQLVLRLQTEITFQYRIKPVEAQQ
ncbi:hypothetical protein SAM19_01454 [Brevibacillus laterosporus]|nr:hypothetical protein [Brevibacillus laterosporus]